MARKSSEGHKRFTYKNRVASDAESRTRSGGSRSAGFLQPLRDGSKIPMYQPKDGRNRIRFLPPTWDSARWFGVDVFVHYSVGPNKASMPCPRRHLNDRCVICEAKQQAIDAGESRDYISTFGPSNRVAYWIIDRDDEEKGVQLWMASAWAIDQDLGQLCIDDDTREVLPVDHPYEGYDFIFNKEGEGKNTKYPGKTFSRKSSLLLRNEDDLQDALDFAEENPLPNLFSFPSSDDVAKEFEGMVRDSDDTDDEEDDFDDEDDLLPGGRGRSKIQDEDDEDDEADEDEDRPVRRARGRVRLSEDEEEADDDDEDDPLPDDDVMPRRRSSSNRERLRRGRGRG